MYDFIHLLLDLALSINKARMENCEGHHLAHLVKAQLQSKTMLKAMDSIPGLV